MFTLSDENLEYQAFTTANTIKQGGDSIVNAGLLSNMVIPTLADSRIIDADEESSTIYLYSTEFNEAGEVVGHLSLRAGENENTAKALKAKKPIQEL